MRKVFLFLSALLVLAQCQNNETKEKEEPKKDIKSTSDWQLDSLNALLLKEPSNPERLADRAAYLLKKGNRNTAKADIYKALSVDSTNARVHEVYGLIYMDEKNSRAAKNEWEKCAELNPRNMACRLFLADLYIAVRNYDRAMEYIDQSIEIDEYESQPYLMKGIVVRDAFKDTSLALQYFQKAIDLNNKNTEALDIMGVTLAAVGDTLAPLYYKRALEVEPYRSDLHYKLGVYYMNKDEVNRALEHYAKAVQLDPQNADAYYNLGYVHIELKMYQEARGYFTKAIQTSEGNYKAHYGRGYAYEMLGDVINAEKDYRKALEYLPIHQPSKDALQRINQ